VCFSRIISPEVSDWLSMRSSTSRRKETSGATAGTERVTREVPASGSSGVEMDVEVTEKDTAQESVDMEVSESSRRPSQEEESRQKRQRASSKPRPPSRKVVEDEEELVDYEPDEEEPKRKEQDTGESTKQEQIMGPAKHRREVVALLFDQMLKEKTAVEDDISARMGEKFTDKIALARERKLRLSEIDKQWKIACDNLQAGASVVQIGDQEFDITDEPDKGGPSIFTPKKPPCLAPSMNRKAPAPASQTPRPIAKCLQTPISERAVKASNEDQAGTTVAVESNIGTIAAIVVEPQPRLNWKTFHAEIKGFREKIQQWSINSGKPIERDVIPINEETKEYLDTMWELNKQEPYLDFEWTDTVRVPEMEMLLTFERAVNDDFIDSQTQCLAVTEFLRSVPLVIVWDDPTALEKKYGELMVHYRRAITETGYLPTMEKTWVKSFFKALRFQAPNDTTPDFKDQRVRLFTQGIEEVENDTLKLAFMRVLKQQKEFRKSYMVTREFTEPGASYYKGKRSTGSHSEQGSPKKKRLKERQGDSTKESGSQGHGRRSWTGRKPVTTVERRCQCCGREHKGLCRYRTHPMRNATDSKWVGSPAANYFLNNYNKEFFQELPEYKEDSRFPPSMEKVVWNSGEDGTSGESDNESDGNVELLSCIQAKKYRQRRTCSVEMMLTVTQGERTSQKRVQVLLDTGDEGPNFICRELVRDDTGFNDQSVIRGVINNESLTLSTAHNITLADIQGRYTIKAKVFEAESLPYDIILSLQTIIDNELLSRFHTDLLDKHHIATPSLRNSFGTKHFVATVIKSNRSRKDPFSLEELAEIEDDELQAIPSELLENPDTKATSAAWKDLLKRRIYGSRRMKHRIRKVLKKYKSCFSATVSSMAANVPEFTFEVDEAKWRVKSNAGRVRKQTLQRQEVLEEMVKTMLEHGIIRASKASFYSHGFVVPKKTPGKWRFVIDYRILNALTYTMEHWPIPHITQLITRIGEHKPAFFAVLDLTSGYHQIMMSEKARELSAFMTPSGVYEWCRLPMGLKGAPSFFQRTIAHQVLHDLSGVICDIYIDDIIIYGKDEDSFIANLEAVFERLKEYGVSVHPDKCVFGKTEVEYVGHVISREGVSFSREKLDQVKDLELPQTVKQLQSFLGICNWFSSHVAGFALIAAPLSNLLHGNMTRGHTKLQWTEEAVSAFETLKKEVVAAQPLFFLDEENPIILQTDASLYGIGSALLQQREVGQLVPIALLSRKFNKVQLRWSTPEKEAYAIYHTLRTWEYLLKDRHFTLETDHLNLEKLSRQCGQNLKVLRWFQAIQDFDMEVRHIPGIKNMIADALSRAVSRSELDENLLAYVEVDEIDVEPELWRHIQTCHNKVVGHGGVERTLRKLHEKQLIWEDQRKHVMKYVRCCPRCQKMQQLKPILVANRKMLSAFQPMQQLAMDFIEGLPETGKGMNTILVIIDSFSRFVELYPCEGTGAKAVFAALLQHTGRYGIPDEILTDNGPAFISELFEILCQKLGTDHIKITPYSHEENGIVERANKEVTRFLADLITDDNVVTDWPLLIPLVQRIMNAAVHNTLGVAPAQIVFGNQIDLDRNLIINNLDAEAKPVVESSWSLSTQRYMDKFLRQQDKIVDMVQRKLVERESSLQTENDKQLHELTKFKLDSLVLVQPREGKRAHKLAPRWLGPQRIVNISDNGTTYTLQDLVTTKNHDYHVSQLKEYRHDPLSDKTPLEIALQDHDHVYIVEKILDIKGDPRGLKSQLFFLVKWLGYEDTTWEPWASLRNVEQLHEFLRHHEDPQVRKLLPKQFCNEAN